MVKVRNSSALFGMFAALSLLIAGIAVAQQDLGNAAAPGATYTTGVVRSVDSYSVTIEKDSGETETLLLDLATVGSNRLASGSRVRIDYHMNTYAQAVADVIQAAPSAQVKVESTPIAPAPAPVAETATAVEPAPAEIAEVESAPVTETAAPVVTESSPDEMLPATASRLPLLLLVGLVTVSTATIVRFAR